MLCARYFAFAGLAYRFCYRYRAGGGMARGTGES